ncbi:MAG: polysaccharide pyruvyl transferase family protein [Verrucomicrobia bacterium]|nr:polysaccharide pyruvyl transferase family protein [Verrucomicrobiota bacterium]
MRILVENGSGELHNLGDVAMLTEAYRCLRSEWPEAQIYVSTRRPSRLQEFCPGAIPVEMNGRRSLSVAWTPWRRVETRLPVLAGVLRHLRMMHANPLNRLWLRAICRYLHQSPADVFDFLKLLRTLDLLVYAGGGYFNDEFRSFMFELVSVGEIFQQFRRPVVAFGQGIGPLSTPLLARPVENLFQNMTAVGTRENISFQWLEARRDARTISVSTGDDVLLDPDLLWPNALGYELGVNVRLAGYAGFKVADLAFLRGAVSRFLRERGLGRLLSIPIKETDDGSTREVLGDLPLQGCRARKAETVRAIALCRVVLTASYHAAVFAYALGVTVVGFAANSYYRQKLIGVAERFRAAPLVFAPSKTADVERDADGLYKLLSSAWMMAPENRSKLLEARREQVSTNLAFKRAAFDRVNRAFGRR